MVMDRSDYIKALQNSRCRVTFTKSDGTSRVMIASLVGSDLPPPEEVVEGATPKRKKAVNEDVVSCWDVEAKGWRSFKISSLVEFEAM